MGVKKNQRTFTAASRPGHWTLMVGALQQLSTREFQVKVEIISIVAVWAWQQGTKKKKENCSQWPAKWWLEESTRSLKGFLEADVFQNWNSTSFQLPCRKPLGPVVFANCPKFRKVVHCIFCILLRVADLEPRSKFGLRMVSVNKVLPVHS